MVGRQVELRKLRQKLLDPDCRLITVLGPGGAGKTCLALEPEVSDDIFSGRRFLAELDAQQSATSTCDCSRLAWIAWIQPATGKTVVYWTNCLYIAGQAVC
jgi:hypothetical protein